MEIRQTVAYYFTNYNIGKKVINMIIDVASSESHSAMLLKVALDIDINAIYFFHTLFHFIYYVYVARTSVLQIFIK
jgi:hypothetical protein